MPQKSTFVAILFILVSSHLYSQKIKYRDIKHNYKAFDYIGKIDEKRYSPALAGLCSYLVPGAGQIYAGETLRGVGFLAGTFASGCVMAYGILWSITETTDGYRTDNRYGTNMLYAGLGGVILFSTWSIVDAILVAHMKNIAYYYLEHGETSLKIEPLIELKTNYDRPNALVCGLSVKVNF